MENEVGKHPFYSNNIRISVTEICWQSLAYMASSWAKKYMNHYLRWSTEMAKWQDTGNTGHPWPVSTGQEPIGRKGNLCFPASCPHILCCFIIFLLSFMRLALYIWLKWKLKLSSLGGSGTFIIYHLPLWLERTTREMQLSSHSQTLSTA